VRVRSVATLTPETAVPVFELRDELRVFRDLKNPNPWTGQFRGSPVRWKPADGPSDSKRASMIKRPSSVTLAVEPSQPMEPGGELLGAPVERDASPSYVGHPTLDHLNERHDPLRWSC
jgi:hypothetical protein